MARIIFSVNWSLDSLLGPDLDFITAPRFGFENRSRKLYSPKNFFLKDSVVHIPNPPPPPIGWWSTTGILGGGSESGTQWSKTNKCSNHSDPSAERFVCCNKWNKQMQQRTGNWYTMIIHHPIYQTSLIFVCHKIYLLWLIVAHLVFNNLNLT